MTIGLTSEHSRNPLKWYIGESSIPRPRCTRPKILDYDLMKKTEKWSAQDGEEARELIDNLSEFSAQDRRTLAQLLTAALISLLGKLKNRPA